MEGLTAKGKPFKDHLDIKGHNEGIDYLMEIIKNRQHLTEKAIRELHKIIIDGLYKPEIMFLFDYKGFIYANSIEETPFEPPKLFLKIDNKEIVLASQKWSISPVLPISPIELQPIHDIAQQFYKQIEQAIEK